MSSNASPFRPVPTLGAFNLVAVFDTNDCWNNLNIAAPGFFETAIVAGASRLFRETGIVLAKTIPVSLNKREAPATIAVSKNPGAAILRLFQQSFVSKTATRLNAPRVGTGRNGDALLDITD